MLALLCLTSFISRAATRKSLALLIKPPHLTAFLCYDSTCFVPFLDGQSARGPGTRAAGSLLVGKATESVGEWGQVALSRALSQRPVRPTCG